MRHSFEKRQVCKAWNQRPLQKEEREVKESLRQSSLELCLLNVGSTKVRIEVVMKKKHN